ncbi:tetratricopeptide repeat protein [uncultured Cellulomonas sp.]|uniref:tetratricopeptide repeat protein n=1 Tax=uncultured Cellulomonas sp. TaxID=189682 RepID=UPI0028EA6F56|nr:tetratricopeptide repeat protein [uncultured Cellulomonas sp.]
MATRSSRLRWTSLAGAVALTGLLGLYVWVVATRATALVRTGEPAGVVLGLGFWILPPLVIWLVAREWRLAVDVQRMADELAAADELPVDDLPRSPGGRIDRAAARAAFEPARELAEAEPDDWRSWYHLAFAYDAAGDRRRARESLRTASRLHRS